MKNENLKNLKDSKKLSPKKREEIYKIIKNLPQIDTSASLSINPEFAERIDFAVARVSEKVIDKINILEATKLVMVRAVRNLEKKYSHGRIRISRGQRPSERYSHADFLILDGNFTLPAEALAKAGINSKIPQKAIIKGDEKVFSCKIASIIAKVHRDRIMEKLHKKYPQYGFSKHKGYGTKYHFRMLKKYGPCEIHRKSFSPIKSPVYKTG